MRLSLVLMTLFAAACSSTLPKAPAKSVAFRSRHPNTRTSRDAIVALTVAFLRAHLRDDASARRWFDETGRADVANVGIYVERKTDAAR